jgi:hypothetical protein
MHLKATMRTMGPRAERGRRCSQVPRIIHSRSGLQQPFLPSTTLALLVLVTVGLLSTMRWSAAEALVSPLVIQVCQNKDCCQRWKMQTPLPYVLQDLLGVGTNASVAAAAAAVTIETTSCLSQCGKGPNVVVVSGGGGKEWHMQGLCDAASVTAQLDSLALPVPAKLLAAVQVLEKAQQTGT